MTLRGAASSYGVDKEVSMTRRTTWLAVLVFCGASLTTTQAAAAPDAPETPPRVRIRPATLAQGIDVIAGQWVEMSGARVVGRFGSRALVVESAVRLLAPFGRQDRVLVLIEHGDIGVGPDLLAGRTVQVIGVARTLLGMQVTGEVPWPGELNRARLGRQDIRAVVLATSVRTADGVELTIRQPGSPVP
jgi:hypothetical protein